ncbi:MAG TPA: phytoene/squalene synthase family protein [Candidatus Hydrogenedentes bacterium]|nr:phytoene/squalene synthase family protein [Candidatus Hydrogenedentota bacterium]HQM50036.1 phytoene/squalene synthase family protein [Candidatus Hydrogenedentota bacterium]
MWLSRNEYSLADWERFMAQTRAEVRDAASDSEAWAAAVRSSRHVLRNYSTSFFIVTRFLPRVKRDQVEVIYSALRYPDEIVDSFAWDESRKLEALDVWTVQYDAALAAPSLRAAVEAGTPVFAAAFAEVVRRNNIPHEYYRDFLRAMRLDVCPAHFETLTDLIDGYVYGSAIVVGYFLAYVYGPARPEDFPRAIRSARDLGIALQLTNFVRDVAEDQRRGRQYLPMELLRAEGIARMDTLDPAQSEAISRVVHRVAGEAEVYYDRARADLDAFSPDSRTAIHACIEVYGRLNWQIRNSREGFLHRETVPFRDKFRLLPASKYWRLPLSFLHS